MMIEVQRHAKEIQQFHYPYMRVYTKIGGWVCVSITSGDYAMQGEANMRASI